jgi:hypothetical protein
MRFYDLKGSDVFNEKAKEFLSSYTPALRSTNRSAVSFR